MWSCKKLASLSVALISLALLTGCALNTVQTVAVDKLCPVWPQITIAKDDKLTPPTATQIEKSNVGREAVGCKYEKPAPAAPSAPAAAKPAAKVAAAKG